MNVYTSMCQGVRSLVGKYPWVALVSSRVLPSFLATYKWREAVCVLNWSEGKGKRKIPGDVGVEA